MGNTIHLKPNEEHTTSHGKTLILLDKYRRNGRSYVKVQCYCGNVFEAEHYNITHNIVQSCGCLRNPNKIDLDLLEKNIKTPAGLWWRGFFSADGNVHDGCLQCKLNNKDRDIFKIFNNVFNTNIPTRYYKPTNTCIWSTRQPLVADYIINKLGILPNKSTTMKWPSDIVDNDDVAHFIRGYFDGDGTLAPISYDNVSIKRFKDIPIDEWNLSYIRRWQIRIIGSNEFIKQLSIILREKDIIHGFCPLYKPDKTINKEMNILNIGDRANIKKFLDWIYIDSDDSRLSRKYSRYLKFLEWLETKNRQLDKGPKLWYTDEWKKPQ